MRATVCTGFMTLALLGATVIPAGAKAALAESTGAFDGAGAPVAALCAAAFSTGAAPPRAVAAEAPGEGSAGAVPEPAASADATPPYTARQLYISPTLALRSACQRLSSPPAEGATVRLQRLLDIAEPAVHGGQLDAAAALLAALRMAGELSAAVPASQARLWLLSALLEAERANIEAEEAWYTRAREQLEQAGLSHTAAFARALLGQASSWRERRKAGDLERAAAVLDRAEALFRGLGLAVSFEMLDVLNERTLMAYAHQDLPATAAAARAEVSMHIDLNVAEAPAVMHAHATLGAVLPRPDEAIAACREGLRIAALNPGSSPSAELGLLNNLATNLLTSGQTFEALPVAERAVAFAARAFGADGVRSVTPLTVHGQALWRLARYAEARRSFERALAIADAQRASIGPLRRLRLWDWVAQTLLTLGEDTAARSRIDAALAETTAVPGLDYWQGRLLRRRAAMAARAGDWARANVDMDNAIAGVRVLLGETDPYVVDMGSEQCAVQASGRLPGTACASLGARLASLDDAAAAIRFRALSALALAAGSRGQADEALSLHLRALAAAESAATPDPMWSAYAALAEHLRAHGEKSVAVLMGKHAVEQIELMRASLGADAARFERGFLADKLGVYRRLADWLTQDDRVDEALSVIRLLKEEELLDFVDRDGGLLGPRDGGPGGVALSFAERLYSQPESALLGRWRCASGLVPATANAPAAQAALPASTTGRESGCVQRWRALLEPAAAGGPAGSAAAGVPRAAALDGVEAPPRREAPPAGELRVWMYPGQGYVNIVIDGPSQRSVARSTVGPAELGALVGELLGAIERREPVQDRLQRLHAELAVPIERAAVAEGARRIVFMVDGPLRYLPFAALHDGRDYLGARYAVEQRVLVPAGSASAGSAPTGAARAGDAPAVASAPRLLAMGVSETPAGMAPLGAVAREICGIVAGPVHGLAPGEAACDARGTGRGAVPGSGFVNREFTAERLALGMAAVRDGGAPGGMLHIGTHFVLRPGRMSRSWLLLGDGQALTLEALSRLDFRGLALITLSACETGIGGSAGGSGSAGASGEEIDGLGALMLRRGAGAVVASLWRVDDASTSVLMQAFYRRLAAGALPAQALREAQATLRAGGGPSAHPFRWAGFYVATGMR